MNKRVASIDILRGITIIAMILCATIGFESGLPGWMFHAQTPPPTYAFNPEAAGITWVDLVFPFFLFSMGAAFPFAIRGKMKKGAGSLNIIGGLVKRWFILTVFALILGNSYAIGASSRPGWQADLFKIALWIGLFLALVRSRKSVNIAGLCIIATLAAAYVLWFGLPLNRNSSDIIIMILANTAIWGGLIWMLTKDSLSLRWLILAFIAVLKAADSYAPEVLDFVPGTGCFSWLFCWEWLQYLVIVVFGSIIGDMILKSRESGKQEKPDCKGVTAGFIAFAAIPLQLWGLYTRHVLADFIMTSVLAAAYFFLCRKNSNTISRIGFTGFAMLLTGIAFDPVDGGITKDYCNLSYLYATGGMAALMTSAILMLETRFGWKGSFIGGIGQNPMLAYTVTNLLIIPVLSLSGLFQLLIETAKGSLIWGYLQGVILTGLMMIITYIFTRLKLFWRS